jgi:hypothetical protein
MQAKMRRNFAGSFSAHALSTGSWHLAPASRSDHPLEIFVRLDDAEAKRTFGAGPVLTELSIEWQASGAALLSMLNSGEVKSVEVQSAIVHEPLSSLYKSLPLGEFDDRARRFWRRVFFLVRIPGGRRLLGLLARRSRRA